MNLFVNISLPRDTREVRVEAPEWVRINHTEGIEGSDVQIEGEDIRTTSGAGSSPGEYQITLNTPRPSCNKQVPVTVCVPSGVRLESTHE